MMTPKTAERFSAGPKSLQMFEEEARFLAPGLRFSSCCVGIQ